jgi:hypothetical protein
MNAPLRSRRPSHGAIDGRLGAIAAVHRLGAANENATPHDRRFETGAGVCWVALLIGLIPVAAALASGRVWGAEPTLGLMISALGAVGLGYHHARAWRALHSWRAQPERRSSASKRVREV